MESIYKEERKVCCMLFVYGIWDCVVWIIYYVWKKLMFWVNVLNIYSFGLGYRILEILGVFIKLRIVLGMKRIFSIINLVLISMFIICFFYF